MSKSVYLSKDFMKNNSGVHPCIGLLGNAEYLGQADSALGLRCLAIGSDDAPPPLTAQALAMVLQSAVDDGAGGVTVPQMAGVLSTLLGFSTDGITPASQDSTITRVRVMVRDGLLTTDRLINYLTLVANELPDYVTKVTEGTNPGMKYAAKVKDLPYSPAIAALPVMCAIFVAFKEAVVAGEVKTQNIGIYFSGQLITKASSTLATLPNEAWILLVEGLAHTNPMETRLSILRSLFIASCAIAKGPNVSQPWINSHRQHMAMKYPDDTQIKRNDVATYHGAYVAAENSDSSIRAIIKTLSQFANKAELSRLQWDMEQSRGTGLASLNAIANFIDQNEAFGIDFLQKAIKCEAEVNQVALAMAYTVIDPFVTLRGPKVPASSYPRMASFCVTIQYDCQLQGTILSGPGQKFKTSSTLNRFELGDIYNKARWILEFSRADAQSEFTPESMFSDLNYKTVRRGGEIFVDLLGNNEEYVELDPVPVDQRITGKSYDSEGYQLEPYNGTVRRARRLITQVQDTRKFEDLTITEIRHSKRYAPANLTTYSKLTKQSNKARAFRELCQLFIHAVAQSAISSEGGNTTLVDKAGVIPDSVKLEFPETGRIQADVIAPLNTEACRLKEFKPLTAGAAVF